NTCRAKRFSDLACGHFCAIGNYDACCARVHEMTCGEFGHFSRADEHDSAALEGVEDLFAELDRHVTDRDRAAGDAGFVSDSFSDAERVMDQTIQHPTDCSRFNSECVGMTNLAQDLRLADDHRIERRSDAEQVSHGFFIGVAIEMRLEESGG